MKTSTYFALLAEFGTAEIPLDALAEKYFGLDQVTAKRRAARGLLPCPAYRGGGQKSPWLINAGDLATHIDTQRLKAAQDWIGDKAA